MLRNLFAGLILVSTSAAVAAQEGSEPKPAPVEVMVLGSYHFANPGQDMVNLEVDDILAPKRQREIEILARTLAQWNPTKVAVEWEAPTPGLELDSYADVDALLETRRNESVQIGYRLAHLLGHDAVYGIDEKPGEGEPDYFPIGEVQAFAAANGQSVLLERLFGEVQARVAVEQAKLPEQSIAQSLIFHNDADAVDSGHDEVYYAMLTIGDGDRQPGAELNAYWYMRNAKMFAKIGLVAEPGDRVFVIVGSGHATWIRHFVRRTPGYELVDALPFVERAAESSKSIE